MHDCKARWDAIPKEKATERKAVQLEYGIYTFCGNAGLLLNTGWEREKVLQERQRFLKNELRKYPKLNEVYQKLVQEEKMYFVAAWQSEIFIRDQWLGAQYTELFAAEASGDAKNVFELKIKIGAAGNVFSAWETWRRENNTYPNLFEEEE